MAVRNEESNLRRSFDRFLNQSYRSFEIVVTNDSSTDHTASLLASYASTNTTLRSVTESAETHPGKKKALATAIANARASWLLATDGDCAPASPDWIGHMMAARGPGTEIVLGYSPYRRRPGLLNKWIRFEALYTAVQYLTASLAGHPYMGVGRNLLYSRTLFDRLGGFSAHEHIMAGDDDLLVNAGATPSNTEICIHPDSWVFTEPHVTWRAYQRQKQRHLAVGKHYELADRLWLGTLAGSHLAHYALTLALGLSGHPRWALALYSTRMSVVWPRMRDLAAGLGEGDLIKLVPAFDLAVATYYLRFAHTLLTSSQTKRTWQ